MGRARNLKMDCDNGLDVLSNEGMLDIIPHSEYDPFEAKFCASLFWLVFHATEDGGLEDVPSQVTSPIQRLVKDSFIVHPEIVQFLTKGEVYCTVCTRIFPGKITLAGHWSVIQTLSRNGIYVVDGRTDVAVTDSSLEQTNPFHQGAHLALMDALMTAYSSQVVNIQSVVQAVRRFSTFSASRELPFDLEDALLLWVNKLSVAVNAKHVQPTPSSGRKLLRNREQEKKIELRAEKAEETSFTVLPVIDDLLKGLCDGRCLLGILLFYEPTVIKIEDIFLTRDASCTDDSIRNLDLFRSLCSQYFCTSVLALKVEDILYGSLSLKINLVALLAEMFSKCERNARQADDVIRSNTSCSENGRPEVNDRDVANGYDPARSHSAPVTRNAQFQEKDISLRIQNFIENGSFEEDSQHGQKQTSAKAETKSTDVGVSVTENATSVPEEDTVEMQGVVVKLRKKVPRNVQPGGGHEAVLSRRMKKSLCSWSQEDHSGTDTSSKTSNPVEQLDAKSDELSRQNEPQTSYLSNESEDNTVDSNTDVENSGLKSSEEVEPSFDLHLNLPEAITPIDLLSPISETTEPGSLGNSSNGSAASPRDLHLPISDSASVLRHCDTNTETEHERFVPPLSRTPRRGNDVSKSSGDASSSVPRGSYVINSVSHTVESAVAAGLPVVERESLRMSRTLRGESVAGLDRSSDAVLSKSSYSGSQSENDVGLSEIPVGSSMAGNRFNELTVHDEQRYTSRDDLSKRRNDSRFSTFCKNKQNDNRNNILGVPQSSTIERTESDPIHELTNTENEETDTKIVEINTKNEKTKTNNEKTNTKNEQTNTKNEKTNTKNEQSNTKNEKTNTKNEQSNTKNEKTNTKNEKNSSDVPVTWFVNQKNGLNSHDQSRKPHSSRSHVSQHPPEESGGTTNWMIAAEVEQNAEPLKKGKSGNQEALVGQIDQTSSSTNQGAYNKAGKPGGKGAQQISEDQAPTGQIDRESKVCRNSKPIELKV